MQLVINLSLLFIFASHLFYNYSFDFFFSLLYCSLSLAQGVSQDEKSNLISGSPDLAYWVMDMLLHKSMSRRILMKSLDPRLFSALISVQSNNMSSFKPLRYISRFLQSIAGIHNAPSINLRLLDPLLNILEDLHKKETDTMKSLSKPGKMQFYSTFLQTLVDVMTSILHLERKLKEQKELEVLDSKEEIDVKEEKEEEVLFFFPFNQSKSSIFSSTFPKASGTLNSKELVWPVSSNPVTMDLLDSFVVDPELKAVTIYVQIGVKRENSAGWEVGCWLGRNKLLFTPCKSELNVCVEGSASTGWTTTSFKFGPTAHWIRITAKRTGDVSVLFVKNDGDNHYSLNYKDEEVFTLDGKLAALKLYSNSACDGDSVVVSNLIICRDEHPCILPHVTSHGVSLPKYPPWFSKIMKAADVLKAFSWRTPLPDHVLTDIWLTTSNSEEEIVFESEHPYRKRKVVKKIEIVDAESLTLQFSPESVTNDADFIAFTRNENDKVLNDNLNWKLIFEFY